MADQKDNPRFGEFQKSGFVVSEDLISVEERLELCQRTADIANGLVAGFPEDDIELEPNADTRSLHTVRKINRCAQNDPVFARHAGNNKILEVVEPLLGPDIKLFGSQAFMKPPGGVEKPYHQDSPYFTIEPMAMVTCWIALDDVTLDNGCLWVIPGSQHLGPLPHSEKWVVGDRVDMRIPESLFDRNLEVPIPLKAGSCSFHHSLLLHMSHPNQSDQPRRGVAFHYMTAKSRWTAATPPEFEFPLLRGRSYPGYV
jgi:hypothetical protein